MLRVAVAAVGLALVYLANTDLAVGSPLYVMNSSCPTGWQQALNNCYLFNVKDQLTWAEARTECAIRNADLMIVRNKQELSWINIQLEYYQTDEWWVGLEQTAGWQWVQYGGNLDDVNWRNEPDNYDGQNCDAINEFGLFSDEFCRSKLGFICKYPISTGEYCPEDGPGGMWFMTDTACYFISDLLNTSLHMNWTQAKTFCGQLVPGKNMQLMSLTDYDDMASFKLLMASYDPSKILLPWWTGLNDQQTEGTYVWQDGTLANGSLITWDVAPSTDRSQNRNCGVMYQGGTIDDVTCDKRAHYVCEMPAVQGHLNLGCGTWLRGGTSCYWLATDASRTWTGARDTCTRANAHLLKVDNVDEKVWIESLTLGAIGYWTGLNQATGGGAWVWDDNSASQPKLIKWSSEPNNGGGNEDCAEIHQDGAYNDRICTAKTAYACEYIKPYDKPCLGGWFQCESYCYYLSYANDNVTVTWYEAAERCNDLVAPRDLSGFRLAVTDKTQQTCVNKALSQLPLGAPGHWTELNDQKIKYKWQYTRDAKNPPNYDVINVMTLLTVTDVYHGCLWETPWSKEPNNFNNSEHCAVMYDGGNYNDLNCAAKAFFICERQIGSSSTSIHTVSTTIWMFLCSVFVLVSH